MHSLPWKRYPIFGRPTTPILRLFEGRPRRGFSAAAGVSALRLDFFAHTAAEIENAARWPHGRTNGRMRVAMSNLQERINCLFGLCHHQLRNELSAVQQCWKLNLIRLNENGPPVSQGVKTKSLMTKSPRRRWKKLALGSRNLYISMSIDDLSSFLSYFLCLLRKTLVNELSWFKLTWTGKVHQRFNRRTSERWKSKRRSSTLSLPATMHPREDSWSIPHQKRREVCQATHVPARKQRHVHQEGCAAVNLPYSTAKRRVDQWSDMQSLMTITRFSRFCFK